MISSALKINSSQFHNHIFKYLKKNDIFVYLYFFRYSQKSGIKENSELRKIQNLFKIFQPGPDLIASCEKFFNINIAILSNSNSRKILEKKNFNQKRIQFSRKPDFWKNLVLFSEEDQNLFYLRYKLDEIIPFLSEADCVLRMYQSDIFSIFGKNFTDLLTEESIETLEAQLQEKY